VVQLFEHAVAGCVTFLRWFRGVDPYLSPGRRPQARGDSSAD